MPTDQPIEHQEAAAATEGRKPSPTVRAHTDRIRSGNCMPAVENLTPPFRDELAAAIRASRAEGRGGRG